MLELPEAELIRRDLDKDITGRKVKEVEVPGSTPLISGFASRDAFVEALVGRKIMAVRRQGLVLLIDLSDDDTLVLDLTGRVSIRRAANKDALDASTALIIGFTQGGQLRVMLPEKSDAMCRIVRTDSLADVLPKPGGFDPIIDQIPWTTFGQLLRARGHQRLRTLLLDDTFIVGIGPVYADEILHAALLRYDRTAASTTIQEIRRLYRAIVEMMHNAVKQGGTSLPDDPFSDVFGKTGGFTEYLEVYGRAGQRSRNGRGDVQKIRTGGQNHFFCDYQV
jgi:formamidopyrimidine-DNA glycosylase